jgi:TolB-like protein/Tfp pilus assembly protein PilF
MPENTGNEEIVFGPFRLDIRRRMLSRDGNLLPLRPRSLEILCVLAGSAGQIISKDELMAKVWPGLVVEENTIQVHVSALRKALGEDIGGQRYIVTIPAIGYRFIANASESTAPQGPADTGAALALPDKPSIAVMPFDNMSGDREQDYFADGMVEDIITALSRMRWLFVIARNSTFTYKGRAVDARQVGRELGIRYVLEGSVRKVGKRVRITGQLIDALTGAHLWADRFDGELADIFELQDHVTVSVVNAIAPTLERAETERAKRKPTESLTAYDYYLRAVARMNEFTREGNDEALHLFRKAVDLDPDFASAHGMAAACYGLRRASGWAIDFKEERAEAARLARRGASLGQNDAVALAASAYALSYVVRDLDTAAALVERALVLDPNLAVAWHYSGAIRAWLSEPDIAIEHLAYSMRLSPLDPLTPIRQNMTGFAHFVAGRYDEASVWAKRALRDRPNFVAGLRLLAASSAFMGRMAEAGEAITRHLELEPAMRLSKLRDYNPLRDPADFARFAEGLRKAGMPE